MEILQDDKASDMVITVDYTKAVIVGSGQLVLEFSEVDKCNYCYLLVEEEEGLKSEKECCFKFTVDNQKRVVCARDRIDCEIDLKRLLKTFF